jgi:hypothetical protein
MKKLLSNLSGRLLALLLPVALVASSFIPTKALAVMYLSSGGGGAGGTEGDPLDTNDYGGGGDGSDIHNTGAGGGSPAPMPLVIEFADFQVYLVPQVVGGKITFRILAVERTAGGSVKKGLEGTHAQ